MLDAFIIEEIKRREREHGREDRPVAELPLPQPPPAPSGAGDDGPPPQPDRGVVIIDYTA
jgi:hypothetical protein